MIFALFLDIQIGITFFIDSTVKFLPSAEVDISEFEESKTYKRELDLEKNGGRMICIFNLSRIDESSTDSSCEISPDDLVNIRKTYVSLLEVVLVDFKFRL